MIEGAKRPNNIHNKLIRRTLQFLVPISLISFLLSHTYDLSFIFTFNLHLSTLVFPYFAYVIDRKYMFLLCNSILVFLAKNLSCCSYDKQEDVLIKGGFYDEQVEVNEEEEVEDIEDTTCLLLDKTTEGIEVQESDLCYDLQQAAKAGAKSMAEETTCLLSNKTVEGMQVQESDLCYDLQQVAKAGTKSFVEETTYLLSNKMLEGMEGQESDLCYDLQQVAKAGTKSVAEETTCLLSDKTVEGMQAQESNLCYDLQQVAEASTKSMVEEGNEDNMSIEELNRKIEEFIRKMKEEIRTEAMHPRV